MIVARLGGEYVRPRASEPPAIGSALQPPASAFDQSLRQYRRREADTRGPLRDSNERATARARRSDKSATDVKSTDARRAFDAAPALLAGPAAEVLRFIPVLTHEEIPSPTQRKAPAPARNSKRRDAAAAERNECIEVVVDRTGTRFVLSRDADRWLVSFPPQALDEAQRDRLVELLREQFAARGLGAVDAIAG
jgi:hypothetical protein